MLCCDIHAIWSQKNVQLQHPVGRGSFTLAIPFTLSYRNTFGCWRRVFKGEIITSSGASFYNLPLHIYTVFLCFSFNGLLPWHGKIMGASWSGIVTPINEPDVYKISSNEEAVHTSSAVAAHPLFAPDSTPIKYTSRPRITTTRRPHSWRSRGPLPWRIRCWRAACSPSICTWWIRSRWRSWFLLAR